MTNNCVRCCTELTVVVLGLHRAAPEPVASADWNVCNSFCENMVFCVDSSRVEHANTESWALRLLLVV